MFQIAVTTVHGVTTPHRATMVRAATMAQEGITAGAAGDETEPAVWRALLASCVDEKEARAPWVGCRPRFPRIHLVGNGSFVSFKQILQKSNEQPEPVALYSRDLVAKSTEMPKCANTS